MSLRPRSVRPLGFIEPCLPSNAAQPPSGPQWLHEIKHDGFRMMTWRAGERVRLFTRDGHDWRARFPLIVAATAELKVRSCVIDGEAVWCDESGLAVFQELRRRRNDGRVFLYAFDLLELDGANLRREPLETRRAELANLLRRAKPGLRLSEHVEGDGATVYEYAAVLGCEGIVSKRKGSRYASGRSRDWIKTKNPDAPAARREAEEDWNRSRCPFRKFHPDLRFATGGRIIS
jgi:ATP-dependent DNA ligase